MTSLSDVMSDIMMFAYLFDEILTAEFDFEKLSSSCILLYFPSPQNF